LLREGELSFTAENAAQSFPVVLSAGKVVVDSVNLVADSDPTATPLVVEQTVFDFATQDRFAFDDFVLPAKGFDQIHVFFDNDRNKALGGVALSLQGSVTLSDLSQATLDVNVPISARLPEEMLAAVTIPRGGVEKIELLFDPTILLNKIDFDALNVGGVVVIDADSPIEVIEAIEGNLALTFSFEGPQGGNNGG
jgi:hypothetical protein